MIGFLKSVFTGPDGVTFDEIKVAFAAAIMGLVMFTGNGVFFQHQLFNSQEFAMAFATIATASGVSSSVKQLAKAMPAASGEPK